MASWHGRGRAVLLGNRRLFRENRIGPPLWIDHDCLGRAWQAMLVGANGVSPGSSHRCASRKPKKLS
jgi:hypothetical protein